MRMYQNAVAIITALIVGPHCLAAATDAGNHSWIYWHSTEYAVSLSHPSNWSQSSDDPARFAGSDGYVALGAANMDKPDLQKLCHSQAFHPMSPFGFNPQIIYKTIDDAGSCLILPSADQPKENPEAEFIALLARPIQLRSGSYNFLILTSDPTHITDIVGTVRFDRPAR